jgi:hypothetical protein
MDGLLQPRARGWLEVNCKLPGGPRQAGRTMLGVASVWTERVCSLGLRALPASLSAPNDALRFPPHAQACARS